MTTFLRRRLLQAVPTLFGITILSFTLLHLAPGDPISLAMPADAIFLSAVASGVVAFTTSDGLVSIPPEKDAI